MTDSRIHFNGINGVTGTYGRTPLTSAAFADLVRGEPKPADHLDLSARSRQAAGSPEALARLHLALATSEAALATARDTGVARALVQEIAAIKGEIRKHSLLGTGEGVDATRLAEAGWGVVFADNADPVVQEALTPLLRRRLAQAGARFKVFAGGRGFHVGDDDKVRFLARNKAAPSGPADPDRVPYYLLIVGDPTDIPFSFQSQLDVQYAVGRLHFATAPEYAAYADNVVATETRGNPRPRRIDFFGVEHPDDPATESSAALLVDPLVKAFGAPDRAAGWTVAATRRNAATRAALWRLLGGGAETPALLFTASHGLEFPVDDPRMATRQGALLCSDYPGPQAWRGPIPDAFCLAGEHLHGGADLTGLMLFAFACFSAGTPMYDSFSRLESGARPRIAPHAFVSPLAQALLGRRGGALAVIGHIDRAMDCSFSALNAQGVTQGHVEVFRSTLARLLAGAPVGHALDYINTRYAELSTMLSDRLEAIGDGKLFHPPELAALWAENNDARGYIILGDPAVRIDFAPDASVTPEDTPIIVLADPPASQLSSRPDGIDAGDWNVTPAAVRALVARLLAERRG